MVPRSPYKWYQNHAPNLIMCERSPRVDGVVHGAMQAQAQAQCSTVKKRRLKHMCSERHNAVQCNKRAQVQVLVQVKKHNTVQRSTATKTQALTPPRTLVFWDGAPESLQLLVSKSVILTIPEIFVRFILVVLEILVSSCLYRVIGIRQYFKPWFTLIIYI